MFGEDPAAAAAHYAVPSNEELSSNADPTAIVHVPLSVIRRYGDLRAAEELRESARLLGHTPLSEREQLRKGERMQVSDHTAGMHAASDILAARADALSREVTSTTPSP